MFVCNGVAEKETKSKCFDDPNNDIQQRYDDTVGNHMDSNERANSFTESNGVCAHYHAVHNTALSLNTLHYNTL